MEQLIQWFPGHIAKAQRSLREKIGMVDCVIELVDARLPISSHFDFIDEIASHKQRVMVINKIDLAPQELTRMALALWQSRGFPVVCLDVPQRRGLPELKAILDKMHQELTAKMKKRGRLPRKMRTMVMGLPNVGKSSLINALVLKKKLKVADKPGVTRQLQWVNIGANLELLDTPGVIPPKFDDQNLALKLALIGSISEYAADPALVAEAGIELIRSDFPGTLTRLFGNEALTLDDIALQRGYLHQGGGYDTRRAAESLLQDLRHARQGRISLEAAVKYAPDPVKQPVTEAVTETVTEAPESSPE